MACSGHNQPPTTARPTAFTGSRFRVTTVTRDHSSADADSSVVTRGRYEADQMPSTTIAVALSDLFGADSTVRLYDYINPDALDTLFGPPRDGDTRTEVNLSFTCEGYTVSVHSNGTFVITKKYDK